MPFLVKGENISVRRGGREILRDVSLDIADGDFVTVIGPNGAGKSMLIKCLLGFYPPDSGAVSARRGLRVGYMPQNLTPDFAMPLSVRRFLSLRRGGADDTKQAAADAQIGDVLDQQMHTLSGGQLQRALLARALCGAPQLLVLDEPAQNLDVNGQLHFYKLLERVTKERQIAVLMVSHDLHFVMRGTKKVVCLFRHICCSGEPGAVAQMPEFAEMFGEEMARLTAVYRHHHTHRSDE